MAKYPYVADKQMYAAVMGACSWIRQDGYFNKAVKYYADKFNVSEKELAKHIRERQSAGQKKNKAPKRKYKWYAILGHVCDDKQDYFYLPYGEWRKIKSTSKENAKTQLNKWVNKNFDWFENWYSVGYLAELNSEEMVDSFLAQAEELFENHKKQEKENVKKEIYDTQSEHRFYSELEIIQENATRNHDA